MYLGIVENDPIFREEVVGRLKKSGLKCRVAQWDSAEAFLRAKAQMDILLLDIMLEEMNGIELAAEVINTGVDTKIIMLTNMNSEALIFDAIQNGAVGYVLKSEIGELAGIVDTVAKGGAILTPTIALRVISVVRAAQKGKSKTFDLTPRQHEILDLMVSGKTIPSVARALGISRHTVHTHVKEIYKKLNVHNRAELVNKVKG